jgi:hypothetical protein
MKYRALKRIKHDGKRYAVSESLEIEDAAAAKRLVTLGAVIAEGVSDTPDTKIDKEPTDEDELTDEEVFIMIDEGFTLEIIKAEMSGLDLELPKSVKNKGDIIKFIIEQEVDEHFLDLLEENE